MILFPPKWSEAPVPEFRMKLLDAPSLMHSVDVKEAMRHAAKTPDCIKQLKSASAAWEVNDGKYIFVFCNDRNEENLQKVTVWAKKQSGVFLRLKTVWIRNQDYIFEAIPYFLAEYFETDWSIGGMISDVEFFYWLDWTLKDLTKDCPASLKKKERLIKDWSAFMPKFLDMLKDLDHRVEEKANPRPAPSQSISKPKSPENLLAENRPIDINELRDAVWNAEYSDPIFRQADLILFASEDDNNEDLDFIEAAVRYDSLMGVQDCLEARPTKYNRQRRLVKWANALIANWEIQNLTEKEFRSLNALYPLHDFFSAIENPKDAKLTAKNLRVLAQCILDRSIPKGFVMLEVLVNAREVCKRMHQELSAFIKDIFESEISGNAEWSGIVDESILYDRLRRLSIQCRSLDLMKYDVVRSYPHVGMMKERGEIFFSKDSRCHVLFSKLIRDFDWQFANADYIERYRTRLTEYAGETSDKTDILNYAAAILNLRLKQGIDIFSPLPAATEDTGSRFSLKNDSEDIEKDFSPKTPMPKKNGNASADTDYLKQFTENWAEKAAECAEKIFLEGSDIETYCQHNHLPLADFKAYFDVLMDKVYDIGVAHQNELKNNTEYRQREIEICRKRKDELYAEMKETSDKLQKILDELDIVKKHLADLENM